MWAHWMASLSRAARLKSSARTADASCCSKSASVPSSSNESTTFSTARSWRIWQRGCRGAWARGQRGHGARAGAFARLRIIAPLPLVLIACPAQGELLSAKVWTLSVRVNSDVRKKTYEWGCAVIEHMLALVGVAYVRTAAGRGTCLPSLCVFACVMDVQDDWSSSWGCGASMTDWWRAELLSIESW